MTLTVRQRRSQILRAWLLLLVVVASVLTTWLALELVAVDGAEAAAVTTELGASTSRSTPARRLRVAVAPIMSPKSSLASYSGLVSELGRQLGGTGELLLRDSYADVDSLLRTRRVDIALVGTWPFVEGERDYGLQLLATPVVAGAAVYHALIIAPTGVAVERIEDLGGRRFAAADPLSNTGWLYVADELWQRGLDPERFFSEVVYTGGHDRSVHAVADGLVDAASVDSVVFARVVAAEPALGRRVRVLQASPAFGMPPLVVSPHLNRALRDEITAVLLRFHETERGRAALRQAGIDRFITPDPRSYDGVRKMAARFRAGGSP